MVKPLLILDLDETLIYATEVPLPDVEPHFVLWKHYYVYKRPFLETFIQTCQSYFELAVWSSATSDYVNKIVKEIFPTDLSLAFVWSRKKCTYATYPINYMESSGLAYDHYSLPRVWFKKLQKVKKLGYDLSKTLMVDNSPEKLFYNYGNAVYVDDFKGDTNDRELMFLSKYLPTLCAVENVRVLEKRGWKSTVNE